MFCWGNTVNGELGLGGIEDNHVLSPEEIINFESIRSVKSGKSSYKPVNHNDPIVICSD